MHIHFGGAGTSIDGVVAIDEKKRVGDVLEHHLGFLGQQVRAEAQIKGHPPPQAGQTTSDSFSASRRKPHSRTESDMVVNPRPV